MIAYHACTLGNSNMQQSKQVLHDCDDDDYRLVTYWVQISHLLGAEDRLEWEAMFM